ncbi:integral membrane protein [Fusarium langsethiae]|uniref:Integral membrane protein n=1 Tax=Fusarium langsethiae TaxID=179993 RepID=A0A0M9ENX0_FUSLA|nr:integral membrane protein [Fusarium langsethiae]
MDYRPHVIASISITLPLAVIVLVLRLFARRSTRAGYGIDDCLAVVAFIGALGYSIDNIVWLIGFGLGVPLKDGPAHLTPDERLERSYLLTWISSLMYTTAIASAKFAVLTFYWRLFRYSHTRIAIQIVLVLCVLWTMVRILLLTMQCHPTAAYWDLDRRNTHCHVKSSIYFFSTGLTHGVLDVVILVLPVVEVSRMRLPLGQKLAVMGLFGFGALVCVLTILVIHDAFMLNNSTRDMTLTMAYHGSLSAAEINLANITISLPMLRPAFRAIIPSSFLSSHRSKRAVIDWVLAPEYGIKKGINVTETSRQEGTSSVCEFAMHGDIPPGYDLEASHAGWSYGTEITIFSPWRHQTPPPTINEGLDGIQISEETTVQVERLGEPGGDMPDLDEIESPK